MSRMSTKAAARAYQKAHARMCAESELLDHVREQAADGRLSFRVVGPSLDPDAYAGTMGHAEVTRQRKAYEQAKHDADRALARLYASQRRKGTLA